VNVHRSIGDGEVLGDPAAARAAGDQRCHFTLSRSERFQRIQGRGRNDHLFGHTDGRTAGK
jgi:hypothetical protein